MISRPTKAEFTEPLVFLPVFSAPDFHPVQQMHGGNGADGTMQFPCPEYHPEVERFIQAASMDCWQDFHYSPEAMAKMIADPEQVQSATLDQIRSLLTYCVRGERFCDGHIGHLIEAGHVARILERLKKITHEQKI